MFSLSAGGTANAEDAEDAEERKGKDFNAVGAVVARRSRRKDVARWVRGLVLERVGGQN